ncbi:hypothetical protein E4U21_000695 [Claviceps maximensis]|nr:hypothetical protein E4U21_000695 [Claviceps maximensis]
MYRKLSSADSGRGWKRESTCCHKDTPHHPPRISKPLHLIQPSYDCVVIGSGYGGAIAASRMARAGRSVCLLERGKERWPGEFPERFNQAARHVSVSGRVRRAFSSKHSGGDNIRCGDAGGLYRVVVGEGQTAVVGNGLGGTSLINSNVFLEADAATLSLDMWPPQIRDNPEVLNEYYQKVRNVLEPQSYPDAWPRLKKTELLRRQAETLNLDKHYYEVPLTTRFHDGPNSCGVPMRASTLSGQDTTGINDGSKTTTLVTYLADAWQRGADIFCQCEVRHVEEAAGGPDEHGGGGYNIYYTWGDEAWERFQKGNKKTPRALFHVHAKKAVFLGAGSLGTTEILLRSKALGLPVSDYIGKGMSGNGDMLAYNCDHDVNAIGRRARRRGGRKMTDRNSDHDAVGPTITATIDMRGTTDNALDGFVIQDGAVPEALARLVQPIAHLQTGPCPSRPRPGPGPGTSGLVRRVRRLGRVWRSRLLGPHARSGAVQRTQVFLVMSHDTAQGTMRLENDVPRLQFPAATTTDESPRERAVHALLSAAVSSVGGTLIRNPCSKLWGNYRLTVHPLGGARMSRDNTARNGVTDHRGRVFTGRTASETHAGLVVVDGAVVPGALGVNPLATIAALAERAVAEYAGAEGLGIREGGRGVVDADATGDGEKAALFKGETDGPGGGDADTAPVSFTECMTGFVDASAAPGGDNAACFAACHGAGRAKAQALRLLLRAGLRTHTRTGGAGARRGTLMGTVVCPALGGSPFVAHNGHLALFQPDGSVAGTSKLVYDFDMTGVDGRRLHFHGYKLIDASASCRPRQLWRALTTLYVTVTHDRGPGCGSGSDPEPAVLARGILRMALRDLGRQLRSLNVAAGEASRRERHASLRRFIVYFLRRSAPHLFVPLAPLQYPRPVRPGEFVHPSGPSRSITITASDGVRTTLHVWEPQTQSPRTRHHHYHHHPASAAAHTKNLLMIPGAAVTHDIFSLPTVPVNAVDYFTRAGLRVFVAVHRIAAAHAHAPRRPWTTYDARLDIRACLEHIRAVCSDPRPYTVAHCMGSVALASGLLDGTIPADWIVGLTCSQVFMNPVWSASNVCKRTSPLALDKLFRCLSGEWFDCAASGPHENDDGPDGDRNNTSCPLPSRPSPRLSPRLLDTLLRIYPAPAGESCRSASCHRTTFLFGRCWNHANLNEPTHRHIDKFFGSASMTLINLLMHMPPEGITTNRPSCTVLTTPRNIDRLRGMPIFLFSGADNDVLSPAATHQTYETLTTTFGLSAGLSRGGVQYRREVFAGYGHLDCWMGRTAYRDVFPVVADEIWRVFREADEQTP